MNDASPPARTAYLLRLEAAVVLLGSIAAFHALGGEWVWFFVLFLAPDLFMAGYLWGPRLGARVYNLVHTYLAPALLLAAWFVVRDLDLLRIATIWTAHIGMDRALGFGLKYATGFKHTHLDRV